jgi:DNA-binding NarL/FixJ family response regulator
VIAGEAKLYLDALTGMLKQAGFDVLHATTNNAEAYQALQELQPHVGLLGMNGDGPDTLSVVADTLARRIPVRLAVLGCVSSEMLLEQIVRLRRVSYLSTTDADQAFLDHLAKIAGGQVRFSSCYCDRLEFDPLANRYRFRGESTLPSLTSRQIEVLRLLARGRSVKEVARALHLSEKSVDSHKYRIMSRLGIHDRVELARYAIREGLVTV